MTEYVVLSILLRYGKECLPVKPDITGCAQHSNVQVVYGTHCSRKFLKKAAD